MLTDKSGELHEQIIADAGKRLQEEIDFSILADMLCGIGWTKVILKPMTWEDGYEIDNWIETNIKGNHETMGLVWVFEKPEDAMWFKLRWIS